jgi:hypothetical protein
MAKSRTTGITIATLQWLKEDGKALHWLKEDR